MIDNLEMPSHSQNSDRPNSEREKIQSKKLERLALKKDQKGHLNLDSAESKKAIAMFGGSGLVEMFASSKKLTDNVPGNIVSK